MATRRPWSMDYPSSYPGYSTPPQWCASARRSIPRRDPRSVAACTLPEGGRCRPVVIAAEIAGSPLSGRNHYRAGSAAPCRGPWFPPHHMVRETARVRKARPVSAPVGRWCPPVLRPTWQVDQRALADHAASRLLLMRTAGGIAARPRPRRPPRVRRFRHRQGAAHVGGRQAAAGRRGLRELAAERQALAGQLDRRRRPDRRGRPTIM